MKSLKLQRSCPHCKKVAETRSEVKVGNDRIFTYTCGHSEYVLGLKDATAYDSVVSKDGKTLYPFQVAGIKHAEAADGRWLCADAMGLGKTIQVLGFIKLHLDEVKPVLLVCKSALTIQFFQETLRWVGHWETNAEKDVNGNEEKKWVPELIPQVIRTSKEKPLFDYFDIFIVSYDLLRRCEWVDTAIFKFIILDECQLVKNPDATRTQCVRKLISHAVEETEDGKAYMAGLSGTPFKNRLMEYFPILNMLRPDKFPVQTHMLNKYADYWTDKYTGQTKVGGLRNPAKWKRDTSDFIIRREREEVLPDLPTLDRRFQWMDLAAEVQKKYAEAYDEFSDAYDGSGDYEGQSGKERSVNILGLMSRMRHLTGLSKIEGTAEFIEDFLDDNDRKLTIFTHHIDVATLLFEAVKALCVKRNLAPPLHFHSGLDADQRNKIVEQFRTGDNRPMIASTLAAGEGINMQFCEDCIIMERQWTPMAEEQCECRFIRIGSTALKVLATYMLAYGTIDDFLTHIVEGKRALFNQVMKDGGKIEDQLDESTILRELADMLYSKGRDKWKLMN